MEGIVEEAKKESARSSAWPTGGPGAQRGQAARQSRKWPQRRHGQKPPEDARRAPERTTVSARSQQEAIQILIASICNRFGAMAIGLGEDGIRFVQSASAVRIQLDLTLERQLWARGIDAVAGVDEVGVGALAGPVVAAAVIIAAGISIDGLSDSKLLTAKHRDALFVVIRECAVAIGLGRTEVEEVDRMNVYWAAMEARRRAVEAL